MDEHWLAGSANLYCRDCEELLTLPQYRRMSKLCDDCEFDSLTPPGWFDEFRRRLERWRRSNMHLFRDEEGLGYN